MNCDKEKEQEFTVVAELPPVVELQPNYTPPDPFKVTLPKDWRRRSGDIVCKTNNSTHLSE